MMKVKILVVLITVAFFLSSVFVPRTFSQENSTPVASITIEEFNAKYKAYLASVEDYQRAYEEYRFKRTQYLNFQTLKSKTEALEATIKMLQARDGVVIAYLESLKARINSAIGVPEARVESLTFRLNEEIAWFSEHREEVTSSGTLEDTVRDSDTAKKRWTTIEPLLYEVLATTAQGRLIDFTERTKGLDTAVKNKMAEIRNDTREDYSFSARKFQILDRWLYEAENKIIRSEEKQIQAVNMISEFVKKRGNLLKSYNDTVATFTEAQILLKESDTFMKEIVREIKTAEE